MCHLTKPIQWCNGGNEGYAVINCIGDETMEMTVILSVNDDVNYHSEKESTKTRTRAITRARTVTNGIKYLLDDSMTMKMMIDIEDYEKYCDDTKKQIGWFDYEEGVLTKQKGMIPRQIIAIILLGLI
jgi:hypothetical protein